MPTDRVMIRSSPSQNEGTEYSVSAKAVWKRSPAEPLRQADLAPSQMPIAV